MYPLYALAGVMLLLFLVFSIIYIS
jgi:hypothetical protein